MLPLKSHAFTCSSTIPAPASNSGKLQGLMLVGPDGRNHVSCPLPLRLGPVLLDSRDSAINTIDKGVVVGAVAIGCGRPRSGLGVPSRIARALQRAHSKQAEKGCSTARGWLEGRMPAGTTALLKLPDWLQPQEDNGEPPGPRDWLALGGQRGQRSVASEESCPGNIQNFVCCTICPKDSACLACLVSHCLWTPDTSSSGA